MEAGHARAPDPDFAERLPLSGKEGRMLRPGRRTLGAAIGTPRDR
jgi:hypothetical protein